jgi:hypothetical protein
MMSLDRYRLLSQLGAGPDGISYRAEAQEGGATVELRDLSAVLASAGRWEKLAPRLRLAARLEQPSAVRVLDLGLVHDPPYVVLEWVGATMLGGGGGFVTSLTPLTEHGLEGHATEQGTGSTARDAVLAHIQSLAGALVEAHRLGLAHGRIGPGRVWLAEGNLPKLDFTGVDAGFPAGSEASRALDAACRDPNTGDNPVTDRAADLV